MNTMLIRSLMPSLPVQPPAGQHRVYDRWRQRERARDTARTTFTNAEDVTGRCVGGALNTDIGTRVRPPRPKSP
jgi:hypothetical protein